MLASLGQFLADSAPEPGLRTSRDEEDNEAKEEMDIDCLWPPYPEETKMPILITITDSVPPRFELPELTPPSQSLDAQEDLIMSPTVEDVETGQDHIKATAEVCS